MSVSADPRGSASSGNILRGDFFGGVAAGVIALPLALAFGVASGLGPAAGLYGAIATGIVAAVFGGTPVQITGPTGPMTLVVAGVVATNTLPSGAVDLPRVVGIVVLAGLLQIALGLFRVGAYIRYVPYPVISGFMSGIGVIIILQQLFPMFGAEPPSSDPLSILRQLPLLGSNVKWGAVAVAALTIATVFILPRFTKAVPASLVALVTGMPPIRPAAIFPRPCPTSSRLLSCWVRVRLSATSDVSNESIAPRNASWSAAAVNEGIC